MAMGIAKYGNKYSIEEYDNDIPETVVMRYPEHNSNANRIESVKYNLTRNIEFVWRASWSYHTPPYLFIKYKGDDIEYIATAEIERVKDALNEYNTINKVKLLDKHILYLKDCIKTLQEKQKEVISEKEKESIKKDAQIETLNNNYKALLEILKNKL